MVTFSHTFEKCDDVYLLCFFIILILNYRLKSFLPISIDRRIFFSFYLIFFSLKVLKPVHCSATQKYGTQYNKLSETSKNNNSRKTIDF